MRAIYALADAETKEIRYVGKTTRSPAERYRVHVASAQRDPSRQPYLYAWWNQLASPPLLVVLERNPPGGLDEAERAWIATLRRYGCRLTNLTEGGDGRPGNGRAKGYKHTEETKEKIRASALGRKHSPETRARMSAAMRGRPKSAEHREKIGLAHRGHPVTEETRRKISKAKIKHGRYSKYKKEAA